MMLVQHGHRSTFDFIVRLGSREPRSAIAITDRLLESLGDDEFLAVWPEISSNESLPSFIIVSRGTVRDWFAWITTFVNIRPFSSFFRVVDVDEYRLSMQALNVPTLGRASAAFVGLVLGELITSWPLDATLRIKETVPLSATEGTLSYAVARSIALGTPSPVDDWLRLQSVIGRRLHRRPVSEILQIADVLRDASSPRGVTKSALSAACAEILETGQLSAKWSSLHPILGDVRAGGTREGKVNAFERGVTFALSHELPNTEFALAFLASRIGPGSLSHATLVQDLRQRFPTIALWYGVCAGLSGSEFISSAFGGQGRHVLRDLLTPHSLASGPFADISLSELEILRSGRQPVRLVTRCAGVMTVELAPGVVSTVITQPEVRPRRSEDAVARQASLIRDLGPAIRRLSEVYARLRSEAEAYQDEPRRGSHQLDIFDDVDEP